MFAMITVCSPSVRLGLLLIRVVEPYACSAPAKEGGRIFMNTGELHVCESVDEIAGVLAHEIGHIIARHIPERRTAEAFARSIAQVFGWNAALGSDLISWRVRTSFVFEG
jgi:predicted Zn-dependent protease